MQGCPNCSALEKHRCVLALDVTRCVSALEVPWGWESLVMTISWGDLAGQKGGEEEGVEDEGEIPRSCILSVVESMRRGRGSHTRRGDGRCSSRISSLVAGYVTSWLPLAGCRWMRGAEGRGGKSKEEEGEEEKGKETSRCVLALPFSCLATVTWVRESRKLWEGGSPWGVRGGSEWAEEEFVAPPRQVVWQGLRSCTGVERRCDLSRPSSLGPSGLTGPGVWMELEV